MAFEVPSVDPECDGVEFTEPMVKTVLSKADPEIVIANSLNLPVSGLVVDDGRRTGFPSTLSAESSSSFLCATSSRRRT